MGTSAMQTEPINLSRWVIFDADNTLWDVESLYNNARQTFCTYVADLLSRQSMERKLVEGNTDTLQRHRDIQLQKTHGYSSARFARSFEDTLSFLLPFSSPDEMRHVRNLAMNVFEMEAVTYDGLESAIDALSQHYRLAIITAGERWVQERRLEAFKFRERFSRIDIVDHKSPDVFDAFCQREEVDRDRSWVVGDSLRSDILPAIQVGLRAVHFEAPNWTYESTHKPDGILSARTMQDVVALVSVGPLEQTA
jgi:putative hydrolase of the HAD superfamily